jgi:hypothetical protein
VLIYFDQPCPRVPPPNLRSQRLAQSIDDENLEINLRPLLIETCEGFGEICQSVYGGYDNAQTRRSYGRLIRG